VACAVTEKYLARDPEEEIRKAFRCERQRHGLEGEPCSVASLSPLLMLQAV